MTYVYMTKTCIESESKRNLTKSQISTHTHRSSTLTDQ